MSNLSSDPEVVITGVSPARAVHGKMAFVKRNVRITISAHGLQRAIVRVGKRSYGGHRHGQTTTIRVLRNLLAKELGIGSAVVAEHSVAAAIRIPS